MKRAQLVELLDTAHKRYLDTCETAQSYNTAPLSEQRKHMFTVYDARAQGQYDILVMIRAAIDIADNTGAWEN